MFQQKIKQLMFKIIVEVVRPKLRQKLHYIVSEIVGASLNVNLNRESRKQNLILNLRPPCKICTLVSKEHKGQGKYWFGIF